MNTMDNRLWTVQLKVKYDDNAECMFRLYQGDYDTAIEIYRVCDKLKIGNLLSEDCEVLIINNDVGE